MMLVPANNQLQISHYPHGEDFELSDNVFGSIQPKNAKPVASIVKLKQVFTPLSPTADSKTDLKAPDPKKVKNIHFNPNISTDINPAKTEEEVTALDKNIKSTELGTEKASLDQLLSLFLAQIPKTTKGFVHKEKLFENWLNDRKFETKDQKQLRELFLAQFNKTTIPAVKKGESLTPLGWEEKVAKQIAKEVIEDAHRKKDVQKFRRKDGQSSEKDPYAILKLIAVIAFGLLLRYLGKVDPKLP